MPATDVPIVASALETGLAILHASTHLDLLARHVRLEVESYDKAERKVGK